MLTEYTADDARRDAYEDGIRALCRLLWEAACDADPALRRQGWQVGCPRRSE